MSHFFPSLGVTLPLSAALDLTLLVQSGEEIGLACVLKPVLSWIVTGVILIIGFLSQLYKYSNMLSI